MFFLRDLKASAEQETPLNPEISSKTHNASNNASKESLPLMRIVFEKLIRVLVRLVMS